MVNFFLYYQSLEKTLEEESERLTAEKAAVVTEFEKVKADLFSRLQAAEKEVCIESRV